MKKLKQGDTIKFIKPHKNYVMEGEICKIDMAMYDNDYLSGVFIKLEHTYIYLNAEDFAEKCIPYDSSTKVVSICHLGSEWKRQCDEIDRKLFKEMVDKKMQEYDYVNPDHYKKGNKEVIDMMVDIWGKEDVAKHCEMNAFKYRMRMGEKPNQPLEQELKKAKWYEDKAKELRNEQK
jgi:hypothetical protein